MHRIAGIIMQQPPNEEPPIDSQTVVRQLGSTDPETRQHAINALTQMGPQVIPVMDALLTLPLQTVQTEKRRFQIAYWLIGLPTAFLIWWFRPFDFPGLSGGNLLFCNGLAIFMIPLFIVGFFSMFAGSLRCKLPQPNIAHGLKPAVQALSQSHNPYAAIALLEALYLGNRIMPPLHTEWVLDMQSREEAREAFIRLLPCLDAEAGSHLTKTHRAHLLEWLKHYTQFVFHRSPGDDEFSPGIPRTPWDLPMTLALLKAYQHLPDTQALRHVNRLANSRLRSNQTPEVEQIQAAARECLPYLQAAEAKGKVSQTLLRAADGSTTTSEQLLRPAQGGSEEDAQQLLRATMHKDET